jgi:hypothetical protein
LRPSPCSLFRSRMKCKRCARPAGRDCTSDSTKDCTPLTNEGLENRHPRHGKQPRPRMAWVNVTVLVRAVRNRCLIGRESAAQVLLGPLRIGSGHRTWRADRTTPAYRQLLRATSPRVDRAARRERAKAEHGPRPLAPTNHARFRGCLACMLPWPIHSSLTAAADRRNAATGSTNNLANVSRF